MHDKEAIAEEVLDWRPPEHRTSDVITSTPDGRTRIELRIAPADPKDKAAIEQMFPMMEPTLKGNGELLVRMIEEEVSKRAGNDQMAEPPLPVSAGRFASTPLTQPA